MASGRGIALPNQKCPGCERHCAHPKTHAQPKCRATPLCDAQLTRYERENVHDYSLAVQRFCLPDKDKSRAKFVYGMVNSCRARRRENSWARSANCRVWPITAEMRIAHSA